MTFNRNGSLHSCFLQHQLPRPKDYVTPVNSRPKVIDDDILIKTITQLTMTRNSADRYWRTESQTPAKRKTN